MDREDIIVAILVGLIFGSYSLLIFSIIIGIVLGSLAFTIIHAAICWAIFDIIITIAILNHISKQRVKTRERLWMLYQHHGLEMCPTCTKPMYFYQPNSSWYCHECSKYTPLYSIPLKEKVFVLPGVKKLEKEEKNILMIVITVFIGMSLVLSMYFYYVEGVSYFHADVVVYSYIVEIGSNQTPFVIEVPFPINKYGYIEKIYDNIEVMEGNCSLNINNSLHGPSLLITGENNVKIKSEIIKEGDIPKNIKYSNLSMTYSDIVDVEEDYSYGKHSWFYSNNDSIEIVFQFDYHSGLIRLGIFWGRFGEWSYSGSLHKGWHQVKIEGYDAIA